MERDMLDNDDSVELIGFNVAGPSRSQPPARTGRRAAHPRRKAVPVSAQEIIEISDSDDGAGEVVVDIKRKRSGKRSGKGKGSAGEGNAEAGPSAGGRRKTPLFLPDHDHDSDEDVRAMLNGGDRPAGAVRQPRGRRSSVDKAAKEMKEPAAGQKQDDALPEADELLLQPPVPKPPQPPAQAMSHPETDRLVAQVLDILPDVDPQHIRNLAALHMEQSHHDVDRSVYFYCQSILQNVLHTLFENPNYPKAASGAGPPNDAARNSKAAADPTGSASTGPSNSAGHTRRAIQRHTQSELDVVRLLEAGPSDDIPPPATSRHLRSTPSAAPAKARDDGAAASDDPLSRTVGQVLEIIPDVDPAHVLKLLNQQLSVQPVDEEAPDDGVDVFERALQRVLHLLFENGNYPKVSKKRKRSEDGEAESGGSAKVRVVEDQGYGSKDRPWRGGKYYVELALTQLYNDFPDVGQDHIYRRFEDHNRLYAPTYLSLHAERRNSHPGAADAAYVPRAVHQPKKRKGKGKAAQRSDAEFEKERAWLVRKLQDDATANAEDDDVEEGEGFECGCCFSTYPFRKMTQCPDAHLFCVDCVTSYASTLLGEHNPAITCMDQSGCKLLFAPSELRRVLTPKLLELYERVSQRKELEAAGLENLEECPFCEYQVVIENEQEKLFRCEREECGAVSCRKCKKLDHLPKSCEEAVEDKKLDARHAIEEAMTAALMRNCPKCHKAFIKEAGCNKMVCPNCRTMSCYICRSIIRGYDHFNQAPPYNGPKDSKKCQLWDSVEERHAQEVAAAAQRAQEAYKREHPEVNEADLKVDLPPPPPKPAVVCNNPNHNHHHHHHAMPLPPPPPLVGRDIPPPPHMVPMQPVHLARYGLQDIAAVAPGLFGYHAIHGAGLPAAMAPYPAGALQRAAALPPPQHNYRLRNRAHAEQLAAPAQLPVAAAAHVVDVAQAQVLREATRRVARGVGEDIHAPRAVRPARAVKQGK